MSLIISIDNLGYNEISELLKQLHNTNIRKDIIFKLNEVYIKYGNELIEKIHYCGYKVFLDLKFHDIPNTIKNYMKNMVLLGIHICTIHCIGGKEMLKVASEALHYYSYYYKMDKPLLLGVTILTSQDNEYLNELGIQRQSKSNPNQENVCDMVIKMAGWAKECELDGVICSPHEIEIIKNTYGKDFITAVPGIRPEWDNNLTDQKRVSTPTFAKLMGADYIIVGRPITNSNKSKIEAIRLIEDELDKVIG